MRVGHAIPPMSREPSERIMFWGDVKPGASNHTPDGGTRRPQLTLLQETPHLHASYSKLPFSPRRRACLSACPPPFSSISAAPTPPGGEALGGRADLTSRLGALGTDTPASPKLASYYFVRSEGEGKLHRSSPPGVSQDEGVQEVCSVRRPRGCGPWGIIWREKRRG